jgi:ssDNA-binding replication factor A large subunit
MSLREELLKPRKQRFEPFEAFGKQLSIRVLSAREYDLYDGQRLEVHGTREVKFNYDNIRARLVVLVLGDAEGNRVFKDGDVKAVGELPCDEVDRIYEAGLRVNLLNKQAEETIRKNSETARNGDSTSSLPENLVEPLANCSMPSTATS